MFYIILTEKISLLFINVFKMLIFALVIAFILVLALVFSSSNGEKSNSEGNLVFNITLVWSL